jgi:hypothetical protein
MKDLRIENVPPKDVTPFRLRCVAADMTMREAILWCIEQIGKGKIVLPEKKAKATP